MDRRSNRQRKVSQRMAVVTDADRKQATARHLEALENDDDVAEPPPPGSDDEFLLEDSDEDIDPDDRKRKRGRGRGGRTRATRASAQQKRAGPKTFAVVLEEAELDSYPSSVPTYLSATLGPPTVGAPRKWCSVCGFASTYTCVRCGARFCSRKCYVVHTDTRCLKFMA